MGTVGPGSTVPGPPTFVLTKSASRCKGRTEVHLYLLIGGIEQCVIQGRGSFLITWPFFMTNRTSLQLANVIADFVCYQHRITIEVDGSHHQHQLAADQRRTAYLTARGWTVVRFSNNDVLLRTARILQTILQHIHAATIPLAAPEVPSDPSPLGEGQGERSRPMRLDHQRRVHLSR
jgi:hypothetical protein